MDPPLRASGGKAARSCLGWPGCPPIRRLSWPSGGGGLGGLTMSEEGGLEEVEESLHAAASCWLNRVTTSLRAASSASRASTRACNRRQLGQSAGSSALMAIDHTDSASGALHSTGERLLRKRSCPCIWDSSSSFTTSESGVRR